MAVLASLPARVEIIDVGPRDGLQNESQVVPAATKIALIERLIEAGLQHIEATSFVSPKWVPQMADNAAVMAGVPRAPHLSYSVLVPNLKGLEAALPCRPDEIVVFAAATEHFSRRNINCSIAESIERFEPVVQEAHAAGVRVRGAISCALGCPYEGDVAPQAVADVARRMQDIGVDRIYIGDTIGVGTPRRTQAVVDAVTRVYSLERVGGHFHDTYGQALANIYACLELGMTTFDSSIAGLGGCPYAKGASGNVATEDVVYLMHGLGIETGLDLDRLVAAGQFISDVLGRPTASRVGRARQGSCAA